MKINILIYLVFTISCNVPPSTLQSGNDSIIEVDTVEITNTFPPYESRDTLITRKVRRAKSQIVKRDTFYLQRPYPPYDWHDTVTETIINQY
jgi:hypothetical protein